MATITLDYNNMMKEQIGENGISIDSIDRESAKKAVNAMSEEYSQMKWRSLPYQAESIISKIQSTASQIQNSFESFVVLGIGGSALGPFATFNALCHPFYNELSDLKRKTPRFYVIDNIDPERLSALFDIIDPEKTAFNIITKSGGTSETMSQLLIICDLLKKRLGAAYAENVFATTDEFKGNLLKLAKQEGFRTFFVPDGVGGRFSELCPVGLLPAAVCGIDIVAMLFGAKAADEKIKNASKQKDSYLACPAFAYGLLMTEAMKKGCNISVVIPYADSLRYFSDWYAQLWAESLGKRFNLDNKEVYTGQTPVKALGVTDQHSQVQLYTEGPFDKVITFIEVKSFRTKTDIPHVFDEIEDIAFLSGHTQNELIAAELFATEHAITKSGHINCKLILDSVTPESIGELIYTLEVATAYAGKLMNINPFDQPGVEAGKNATYALLGKPGYKDEKEKLLYNAVKKEKFII